MPDGSRRIPVAMVSTHLGALAAFALSLAAGDVVAQGFSFSQPDTSAQREQQAREQRVAELLSTPCRAGLKDKKIMVVIGESVERHRPRPAAGLRSALRGDQPAPALAGIADLDARGDPPAGSAGGDRRVLSQRSRRGSGWRDRLAAHFILRGLIYSQTVPKPGDGRESGRSADGFHSDGGVRPQGDLQQRGAAASYAGPDVPAWR